ncbi:hypothetical protein [Brevibacterium sediminis]
MSNPAFELIDIFDEWKARDSPSVAMETQRQANTHDGLKKIRRAFRLVGVLEAEVERLAHTGIDPTEYRNTLNFCARAIIGVPGAWQSRPDVKAQFPADKISLLRSLGHVIALRNGTVLGVDPARISQLLDEIETTLDVAPLTEVLDKYIRRLIGAIREALAAEESFTPSAIADDLFQLVVATKAAESVVETAEEKSAWSRFWDQFLPAAASSALIEGGKALLMLPFT